MIAMATVEYLNIEYLFSPWVHPQPTPIFRRDRIPDRKLSM
jgi:hypothetical protein